MTKASGYGSMLCARIFQRKRKKELPPYVCSCTKAIIFDAAEPAHILMFLLRSSDDLPLNDVFMRSFHSSISPFYCAISLNCVIRIVVFFLFVFVIVFRHSVFSSSAPYVALFCSYKLLTNSSYVAFYLPVFLAKSTSSASNFYVRRPSSRALSLCLCLSLLCFRAPRSSMSF